METLKQSNSSAPPDAPTNTRRARRPFQTPRIVFERELTSLAQGIGPFSTTGT